MSVVLLIAAYCADIINHINHLIHIGLSSLLDYRIIVPKPVDQSLPARPRSTDIANYWLIKARETISFLFNTSVILSLDKDSFAQW